MAHFVTLNESKIVTKVEVINNDVILDGNGVEQEQLGKDFLTGLYGSGTYLQASYNGKIRKNYPDIGDTYDSGRDAFIAPKPYNSWILNETTCRWESPVPYPDTTGADNGDIGELYEWNETKTNWQIIPYE